MADDCSRGALPSPAPSDDSDLDFVAHIDRVIGTTGSRHADAPPAAARTESAAKAGLRLIWRSKIRKAP